jgi:hypothetical protein
MTDAVVISDSYRVPTTAQRLQDGRIMIRTPGKPHLIFSAAEVERLYDFTVNRATLQRYPVVMAPESTLTDEHVTA